jgi:hypothetical protein
VGSSPLLPKNTIKIKGKDKKNEGNDKENGEERVK